MARPDYLEEENEFGTGGSGYLPPETYGPTTASSPSTPSPQADPEGDDVLRNYLLSQADQQKSDLQKAQETAATNRLYAQLSQAAATLGAGIAGAQRPDSKPFDQLIASAQQPVTDLEQQQKLDENKDKILRDYLLKNAQIQGKKDVSQSWQQFNKAQSEADQKFKTEQEEKKLKSAAEQKELDRINQLKAAEIAAKGRGERQGSGFEFRDKQFAERTHNQVMNLIDRDPTLKQQFTQIRNLDNAGQLVANAAKEGKPITKQQFEDFQQAVISNLGTKGQQAVHERNSKYFTSLGINGEAFLQFVTGVPQNIGVDNPLYKHVADLAHWEVQNVQGQIQDQIDVLTAGRGYIYDENPKLKADLQNKINALTKKSKTRNFETPTGGNTVPNSGPKPPVKQNGHIYYWNAEKGKYE